MGLLIILFPFLGFLSGSLFGRFLGRGVILITPFFIFLSFLYSLFLIKVVIFNKTVSTLLLFKWVYSDQLLLNWSFCYDSLTCSMLFVVTFISTLVHLYSTEYMKEDPHLSRFMSYLSLFTFFMLILVTANNFIQLFLGWEGVGVSSYLLINFWFTRIQANKAAIKAMIVNRIGDFFMVLSMCFIFLVFHSFDFQVIFVVSSLLNETALNFGSFSFNFIDVICIFLFLGATGKSAQLGLHVWLPDAMEGPTPVSALIHAATMVTAGVFLIIRCSFLFEKSYLTLEIIAIVGASTAFFAGSTGLFQNDMKRVIAYSTCSQLGYMIYACGLSSYDVAFFHLSNHAFFKALLFLGAGSVIHAISDEQDMRKMGGLSQLLPFTFSVVLVGSLALTGFPFLAGFYSKDIILEVGSSLFKVSGYYAFILGLVSAFFTAFYSIRLLFLSFLSNSNNNKKIFFLVHEGGWRIKTPLFFLTLFSITCGYLTKDMMIGFGTDFWGSSLFISSSNYSMTKIEFVPMDFKLLPFFFTISGYIFGFFIYSFGLNEYYNIKLKSFFISIYTFFNKKWYFDRIYNEYLVQNLLFSGYSFFYQTVDRGILEMFGPSGISKILDFFADSIKTMQNGFILTYLYFFIFSLSIFISTIFNSSVNSPYLLDLFLALKTTLFFFFLVIKNKELKKTN